MGDTKGPPLPSFLYSKPTVNFCVFDAFLSLSFHLLHMSAHEAEEGCLGSDSANFG